MNKIKTLLITTTLVLLVSLTGYGQGGFVDKGIRDNNEKFSGLDIAKNLNKQEKDTIFTRYFNMSFPVDSVSHWTTVVKYVGKSLGDNKYLLKSKIYKVDYETGKLVKATEVSRTILDKKGKKQDLVVRRLLKGGLVEEYKSNNGKESTVCYDKNGSKVNDKGCLLYSYSKYPRYKTEVINDVISHRITTLLSSYSGNLPSYILVNIDADYLTKKWNVAFEFSKGYKIDNGVNIELLTTILGSLSQIKLEEYNYNKDIYGNYYNYMLSLPISFVKSSKY